jgi:hypothetical protein
VYKAHSKGDFDTLVELIERMITRGHNWSSKPPQSKDVFNPLFNAIENESVRSVERILTYATNSSQIEICEPIFGRSPLHIAVLKRNLQITQLLIEAGADPFRQDVYGKSARELLPFHMGESELEIDFQLDAWEQQRNEREFHAY